MRCDFLRSYPIDQRPGRWIGQVQDRRRGSAVRAAAGGLQAPIRRRLGRKSLPPPEPAGQAESTGGEGRTPHGRGKIRLPEDSLSQTGSLIGSPDRD